jgi:hypothetical protein
MHYKAFPCPRDKLGRLIGKHGSTIQSVQTFARVGDPPRVHVLGDKSGVELAISKLEEDIIAGTFKGFTMLRELVQSRVI